LKSVTSVIIEKSGGKKPLQLLAISCFQTQNLDKSYLPNALMKICFQEKSS